MKIKITDKTENANVWAITHENNKTLIKAY